MPYVTSKLIQKMNKQKRKLQYKGYFIKTYCRYVVIRFISSFIHFRCPTGYSGTFCEIGKLCLTLLSCCQCKFPSLNIIIEIATEIMMN